jgi:hypothetical protein
MGIERSKVQWIRMGKDLIWAIEFNQWEKIGRNLSLTIVLEKDGYGSWQKHYDLENFKKEI